MTEDEKYMTRCIELALRGRGRVSPNPLVGCVIVKKGKIIAEGWQKKFGKSHAEVNAVNSAIRNGIDVRGSKLYVNLEPCYHYGKTPPCVDMIIKSGIKEVIIGSKDPNPIVCGKSVKKLRRNGIRVKTGILKQHCDYLNRYFFKWIVTGLPYVIIKSAQSLDAKISYKNKPVIISSPESRKLVHGIRAETDAVMIGAVTLRTDNPSLTVRLVKGRNPYRIVIGNRIRYDSKYNIFNDEYMDRTIVISSKNGDGFLKHGIKFIKCRARNGIIDIRRALEKIGEMGITSLLVEGGAFTHERFIEKNLWDEMLIFISPKIIGKGIGTFSLSTYLDLSGCKLNYYRISNDILMHIENVHRDY